MRREYSSNTWGAIIAIAIIAFVALLAWDRANAATTEPYYRVQLMQGTTIAGYGQGATQEDAWRDCLRLASLTRSLTAAETRSRDVAAITRPTTRYCRAPTMYVTVSPDPTTPTCPTPNPATRTQQCPSGFTGTWEQSATVGNAPGCVIEWTPTTPSAGACTPIVVEPPPPREATLTWSHSGAEVTGFRIVYGTTPTALVTNGPSTAAAARAVTIPNLAPGTYYFAVKAYNANGESAPSNVLPKTVR